MLMTSRLKSQIGRLCPILFLLIIFSSCSHRRSEEENAIIAVVEQAFRSMADKDSASAKAVMLPEGRFFSIREDGSVRIQTHREFFEGIASSEEDLLERMWEPEVLIHSRIAILWTPYDFHRNGKFSHCGVDAFSLLKTSTGWKIAGTIYTVEPTGCEESPLGPPQ